MGPIICVCTGNICRSPMAERLLAKALQDAGITNIKVISAGVGAYDGNPASSHGITVMDELGLDLRDHRSQLLTRELIDSASLILVMTQMHKFAIEQDFGPVKTPVHLWREFRPAPKQVSDPYGAEVEAYLETRESIAEAVEDWVKYVKEKLQ